MFQGSHGLEDEARITLQGFMMTAPNFNATHSLLDMCWGGGITSTPAGAAQVGIHRLFVLNRPLKKPSHGVQIVIDSPFNVEVNGVQAKALVYLPKARLSVATIGMDVDAASRRGGTQHPAAESRYRGVHRLPVR